MDLNCGMFLTEAELRQLPTPRLLAYYKKRVLAVHESSWDDIDRPPHQPEWLCHKSDPGYTEYCHLVRKILSEREHVTKRRAP
jgi:hypothetical protein